MFADIVFTTEGTVIISGLLSTLAATIGILFKHLLAAKDKAIVDAATASHREIEEIKDQRKSYKEMASDAMKALEEGINISRKMKGLEPKPAFAPVVAEHHSPASEKELETAELQTMRARLTSAALSLGLPPRTLPPGQEQPNGGKNQLVEALNLEIIKKAEIIESIAKKPPEPPKE